MESFPPIPYEEWVDTKETLHRFAQVVGKIRLAAAVRRNHWWHVPFHLTGRGITTGPMGTDAIFTIDFDFVDHRLAVHSLSGRTLSFPLAGHSVASFSRAVDDALDAVGVSVVVAQPGPFDLPDAGRRTPFRRGYRARVLRPGMGDPLLARAQPGQPGPRVLRR